MHVTRGSVRGRNLQADSLLTVVPGAGLDPMTHETMAQAEIKESDT